ncbi:putative disease resistance RPP13-like protein 1 [Musa acuminata AAA Group]|uniref:putative disease resistance RPP13-like protein 1 n=1 Tax=Musa acuminata AAA Group TaxID=214697 RepID=UPI0031E11149
MSSWILAGLGSLGSSFIGSLMGKISDYVIERVLEDPGVADLHELRNTLSGTERIIGRVENMWIKDEDKKKRLKELLMKLKDTVYDADDLLDEIQFRVLKQQIEQQGAQGYEASNQSSSSSRLPTRKKRKIYERVGRFFGREDDDVIRVRKIQTNLDKYTTDIEHFIGKLDADEKQMITSVVPRTTTSFPIETQVFGRDEQLNHLLEQLMKSADGSGSSNSSISTLTIVGIGGVGKTTLAQQAYNHERGKDYFHPKVWLCVSDDFNVERLTKEIIESLTRNKCDLNNFDTLQVVVKEELTSKRFLLVLDDVWNEDSLKWERFCAPLRYGVPGSKILVTTRSEKIAEMVGNRIHLGGLDEASYWKLFKKCAFGSEDAGEFPQLEAIAKKIVGRLKGLPLAARTVGGLLKAEMNEEAWRIIAGNEIWQLPQNEEGVLPVLQLSYQCLPSHLKRCFVFCSMFPKDYPFNKRELSWLWMAEGYVAQDNNMTTEDTGSRYFLELVNRSFFQEAPWGSQYVMHDLIHDLAQFISEGEFCRINDESKEIPNTTRHLSATLTDGTKLMELSCYDKLRTLMINSKNFWFGFRVESPLFIQFEKLKNIRVLKLHGCGLRELPETIGELIHLRYLDISYNCQICRLSESLCGLYNLRVLDLQGCELQSFPHGMSKLINLMHLNAADEIISKINNVGKLASLRGLSSFKVLKDQGHEVAQLGSLQQLHGPLRITNLENVESKQEASKANLNNKEYLDELVLEWTKSTLDGNELVVSEEVLEGLQPHQALKRLTIRGYNGVRSPSWLQAQLLVHLGTLRLINCKAWKDLSCIGQLPNLKNLYVEGMPAVKQISHELSTESKFLPNLERLVLEDMMALEELPCLGQLPGLMVLHIEGMPAVKKVGDGFFGSRDESKCFPSLEELTFRDMPQWEEWSWADDRQLFPCLRNLEIGSCPRLKRMPPLPTSVESLSLCEVGLTEVPRLWEEIDGSSSSMIVSELKIYSLEVINLVDIPECEELPCLGQLPGLKVLHIEGMPAVKKVGDGFFGSRDESKCFPSLEELTFRDMPQWEEWSWADGRQLFPCLRKLQIERCPRLKRMPPLPPPLQTLNLHEVGLTELPGLWEGIHGGGSCITASLSTLTIRKCPNLRNLEEGLLSHSLPNISDIEIAECAELVWLPVKEFKELTSLAKLSIRSCPKLLSMTRDGDNDILLPPSIKELVLSDCGNLGKLLLGCLHNLTSLTRLEIGDCRCIESLPATSLLHLKRLEYLKIWKCGELRSKDELLLNEGNERVEGSSVTELCIDDTALFKLSLLRRILPSVRVLTISNFPRATMSDEEEQLLRSLTALRSLEFKDCKNLQSLPTELHALPSLRLLKIIRCPKIQVLPEKGLPTSLPAGKALGRDEELGLIFGC